MIRTKGEAGSGNIVEAVKHMRTINEEISNLNNMNDSQLEEYSLNINAPLELLIKVKETSKHYLFLISVQEVLQHLLMHRL